MTYYIENWLKAFLQMGCLKIRNEGTTKNTIVTTTTSATTTTTTSNKGANISRYNKGLNKGSEIR